MQRCSSYCYGAPWSACVYCIFDPWYRRRKCTCGCCLQRVLKTLLVNLTSVILFKSLAFKFRYW